MRLWVSLFWLIQGRGDGARCRRTVPVTQEQQRSWWRRAVLPLVIGVAVTAAVTAFGLVWWLLPPVLYAGAGVGPNAENVRVKAITDTRTALLAGLVGLGALGTFWLNGRI